MAKKQVKQTTRKTVRATPVLSRIQGGVKQMQRDAEAVLERARKEATRLSRDQRRVLDGVIKQAQRLRADFEKLVKRTSKEIEARPKRFLATLEKEVERRLEPIVKRLLAPSRHELQRLSRRVQDLEERMEQHTHAEPPGAPLQLALPPDDVVVPSAGD